MDPRSRHEVAIRVRVEIADPERVRKHVEIANGLLGSRYRRLGLKNQTVALSLRVQPRCPRDRPVQVADRDRARISTQRDPLRDGVRPPDSREPTRRATPVRHDDIGQAVSVQVPTARSWERPDEWSCAGAKMSDAAKDDVVAKDTARRHTLAMWKSSHGTHEQDLRVVG